MRVELEGANAIVTGASTGIGRATAIALAEAGANVAIHYATNRDEAEQTATGVRERGGQAFLVQADLRRREETAQAIVTAASGLGGSIDVLVNNAGSLVQRVPIEEMPAELWEDVLALNLSSTFYATQAALPHLSSGARIVNVTSIAAHSGGGPHAFAYAAAKGGVISLTRGLAKELAPRGIRVNAISPGTVTTPFHERFSTPEGLEQVRRTIPLGRLGAPEDCAAVILFLASHASEFLTGEVIEVNGGQWFA